MNDNLKAKKVPLIVFTIFVSISAIIFAGAYGSYRFFVSHLIHTAQEALQGFANMKVTQIEMLRTDWRGDAAEFASQTFIWKTLGAIDVAQERPRIEKGIADIARRQGYLCVFVVDTANRIVAPATAHQIDPMEWSSLSDAIKKREFTLIEPHLNQNGEVVYGIAYPVFANGDENDAVIGAIFFEREVQKDLWPILEFQLTSSSSAETLLARREGDEILYLSRLRFKKNVPPLSVRLPISQPTLVKMALVSGQLGFLAGLDYRGEEVIGSAHLVSGTSWVVITKIDRAEIEYLPRMLGAIILSLTFILIILLTTILWLVWYRKLLKESNLAEIALQESERKLKKSEEMFRIIYDLIPVGISITDPGGHIIDCNKESERLLGITSVEHLRRNYVGKEWKIIYPDGTPMPSEEYPSVRALKERQLIHNVEMGIVKSKGITWISVSAIPANHLNYGVIIAYVDITMRKETEMALIASERKLRKYQTLAKIGTWQWNIKTNSHIWSEEMFSIYGRDPNLLPAIYPEVQKYFTPKSWVPLAAAVDKCLANGDAYECDAEVVRTDGTHRWIIIMCESVRNEEGQIIELHGIIQDLTERWRMEITIRETERLLNDIQSKTGFGIWSYDVVSQTSQWSKEMFNIWGMDPGREPISYSEYQQWIHPNDHSRFDEAVREAVEFGKPYVLDLRIIRPDKTERTITIFCEALADTTGQVVKLRGSIYDITQRKQMEHNLQESEFLYRSLVNNVPDYVIRFDRQHRHIFANDRSINSIGKTKEECIGKTYREIGFPEHLCDSWEHIIDLCFETKMLQTIIIEWENADEVKILEWRAIPEFHQNNNVDTVLVIARDITERKHAEIKLIDEQKNAQQANLAKSRFLATMSHEIRTPMNGILGMAQMLLMPDLNNSERQDYAKIILNSGQTLLALLNDILDLSKVEAGKTKLEFTALDPGNIIQEIKMLFAETARFKSLSIEMEWSGSNNQSYFCDPYRLRQMLSNLVSNAIKFTTKGGIRIIAREVERNERTATLEFSVSDTGLGIKTDVQRILFEPFSQGDSSITRQHGGTGLGLSIVRGLARLMGGEVGCESELGQGSRFWFTIRADLVTEVDPIERSHNDANLPIIFTKLSGRVLVAEDNSINCKVIEDFLGLFGITVAITKNGQQALDAIMEGDRADLILMDLHMPVMDGYTATERIRFWEKENGQPRRPIIAMTSDAFEEDKERCLATGMDDFLTKPIMIESLKKVLTRWLNVESITIPLLTSIEKKPVDVPRVISIIRELIPLLVKNKFDAIRHFNILQETLEGTDVAVEIAEIGQLVKEFNFSRTLEYLHQIIITRGWEKII